MISKKEMQLRNELKERWGVRNFTQTCPECHRVFDMLDETDVEELGYGHDCEAGEV